MYKKERVNSNSRIISTDEDASLRIESSAIINLRGVSTKLNKYIVFTMQTYKKLKKITVDFYNFEENSRRRPYVSTCGLYFFLPRGFEDPEEFSKFMGEALLECHGFGKL